MERAGSNSRPYRVQGYTNVDGEERAAKTY